MGGYISHSLKLKSASNQGFMMLINIANVSGKIFFFPVKSMK